MPGIYLSNDANCSKSLLTVENLVQSLLPRRIVITRSSITRKGYRFDVTQESDVNLFFSPEVLDKLREVRLTPDLCKETQKDRVIFIADVNLDTFYKNESALKDLICEANNISLLKVNKFVVNNHSRRRYIKIFLDSKEQQTRLLNKASIKLDQVLYPIEAPHNKNVTQQPVSQSQAPINRVIRGNSYGPQVATGLSAHSVWGDPASHGSKQQSNTQNSRAYPEYFSKLCEALYQGLEHPERFIFIFNQTLSYNGYQDIKVPQNVIDVSKEMYLQKRLNCIPPGLMQPPYDNLQPPDPSSPPPQTASLSAFPPLSSPLTSQAPASAPPLSPISSYSPPSASTTPIVTTSAAPTPASKLSTTTQIHSAPLTVTISSTTSNKPSICIPNNSSLTHIQTTYQNNPHHSTGARYKSRTIAPYPVSQHKSSLSPTPTSSHSLTPTSQSTNYLLRERPVDQPQPKNTNKNKKITKNNN